MWLFSLALFLLGIAFPLRCLLDKHDRRILEQWQAAAIFSLGKLTGKIRHAGFAFTMPWETMRIIDTRDDVLNLPLEKLSTGGSNPMEFDVDLVFYFARTDPAKYTTRVAGDEPDSALIPLVRSAVTTALNATAENVLVSGGLPAVLKSATDEILAFCSDWGITARKLLVEDLGLPVALLEAAAARAKAQGEADAMKILADMRVETFLDLKKNQQDLYIPLATLEALKEMAAKGSFRVVGSMDTIGALGKLGTLVGADLLDKEASK